MNEILKETRGESRGELISVLLLGTLLGLLLNWLALYTKISMGFLSVSMGSLAALLIAKIAFRPYRADSKRNLTIIAVCFGATRAAEATVGLLFVIWLFSNVSFFNSSFDPPSWLLPSTDVISNRTLLSFEWIPPLAVHYFLMLVPGVIGIIVGWVLKDRFIKKDKEFPFPGIIQSEATIDVLSRESKSGSQWFLKSLVIGFLFALLTSPLGSLDLSNLSSNQIFGISLGVIGVTLFSAGFLINRIRIVAGMVLVTLAAYSILPYFFELSITGTDFFQTYNIVLQEIYFSFAIGLLFGGMLLGPIVWSILKSLLGKKETKENKTSQRKSQSKNKGDNEEEKADGTF